VVERLKKLSDNLTVITIAHRLETIKDYDRILVFLDGKIV
jgi:ABC-type multidrug transport system fused ATPase/permease subunit